jgi:hypothetical protein
LVNLWNKVRLLYYLHYGHEATHFPIHSFPVSRKVTSKHEDFQGFCLLLDDMNGGGFEGSCHFSPFEKMKVFHGILRYKSNKGKTTI